MIFEGQHLRRGEHLNCIGSVRSVSSSRQSTRGASDPSGCRCECGSQACEHAQTHPADAGVLHRPGSCIEAAGGIEACYQRNAAALKREQSLLALLDSIRKQFAILTDEHRTGIEPDCDEPAGQAWAWAEASLLEWLRARGEHREYRTDVDPLAVLTDLLTRIETEDGAKELLRVVTYDAGAARDREVIDQWTRGAP